LLVIGDKDACLTSSVNSLTALAQYPKVQNENLENNYRFDSIVEEKLFKALQRAGIETAPQYPVLGRRLDLAIIDKKIDIEVDGKRWHLNSEGSRKLDDHFRDLQLTSAGWKVIRFWAFEINNHIEECVNKVKEILK
jgi:very-short-patch-repair endonuclease